VSKSGWTVRAFSSAETSSENSPASYAIDGNLSTKWRTKVSSPTATAPHWIEIDMGATHTVSGFLAAPRQDGSTNGLIREFIFYVSTDGTNWQAAAGGTWLPYYTEVYFAPTQVRYFKFVVLSGTEAAVAELDILQNTTHTPIAITPRYRFGSGSSWTNGTNISVSQGSALSFGPQASGAGTWAWALPNGTTRTGRDYSVNNLTVSDSGVYTVLHLDQYQQSGKIEYHVMVNKTNTVANSKLNYAIQQARAVVSDSLAGGAALQSSIDIAVPMLENTYSIAQKDSMTAEMLNATATYLALNIAAGIDETSSIASHSEFTNATLAAWTGTPPTSVGYGSAEFKNTTYTFLQEISNLENSYYLVGVQALYRAGDNDAGAGYENANEQKYATFFAGDSSIFVQSLYSVGYTGGNALNGYANTLGVADHIFEESVTDYANWLLVKVEDGTLTIGLEKITAQTNDWTAFNNFRLIRIAAPSGIDDISVGNDLQDDNRIFGIDGKYLGTGTPESLGLNPGVYIRNHKKLRIKN
jgi:hypothetical protein